jgi:hypothetical protein
MDNLKENLSWIIASVFIFIFAPTWALFTWFVLQTVMSVILYAIDIEYQRVSALKFYILCGTIGFPLLLILEALK